MATALLHALVVVNLALLAAGLHAITTLHALFIVVQTELVMASGEG
jgi:hypothetical protein